jgi:hypothetical protein
MKQPIMSGTGRVLPCHEFASRYFDVNFYEKASVKQFFKSVVVRGIIDESGDASKSGR